MNLMGKVANIVMVCIWKLRFSEEYLRGVQEQMVPVVVESVVEAINQRDGRALERLFTPSLANTYKQALADLEQQQQKLTISVENLRGAKLERIRVTRGPPGSFDARIPFAKRAQKFFYGPCGVHCLAFSKTPDGSAFMPVDLSTMNAYEIGFELWCQIMADVKVELRHQGQVVWRDSGSMKIPLSLVTPQYPMTINPFKLNVSKDMPFQWLVSDLFSLVALREQWIMKEQVMPKVRGI
ncbi:hypothetical protein GGF46_004387 [Coemansia sp. RSA 552]|nr:hypothetical protein GGF46_004387 [Coemansia sp. RSA 552]